MSDIKVELYDRDGTYMEDLATTDVWDVSVRVDRGNACRRTATSSCSHDLIDMLRIMGRQIKVSDGTDAVFYGYSDGPSRSEEPSSDDLVVNCRDKTKRLLLAGFASDTTYEDLAAVDTQRAISSASVTTSMAAGAEIQKFGVVYDSRLYATVLGTEKQVTPSAESGDILAGDYSVNYSETGLAQLRLKVGIDLRVLEAVTAATITTNGTVVTGSAETSQDGLTWSAYAGTTNFLYLRFEVTMAAGPITLGVAVTTSATYSASNVLTDDADSWRPAATDLDRRITLDLGLAQTCNVLYLRWGITSLDRASVFTYKVERSTDALTWTTVGAYTENGSYLAEHLFAAVSLRYLRITLLTATDGLFALRYADLRYTVSTVSIDTVIEDIAADEGETLFDLTTTQRYVPGGAVTFEAGSKKWDACKKLAESIGFELYYSRTGYLTLKPRDKYDLSDVPVFDDVLRLTPDYGDADVFNQQIAVYESKDTSLRSVAQDLDAMSPTSIPNVGTRTAPVIKSALADTQSKLDALALMELQRTSRQKVSVGFEDISDVTLDAGDVVKLVDERSGLDGYYILDSFTLSFAPEARVMTCEVIPL